MRKPGSTTPSTFFFLVLPYGISSGFVSITLPFVLVRAGFSVAISASIVAIGVSANLWRFLWGPVADLTLTARKWYDWNAGPDTVALVTGILNGIVSAVGCVMGGWVADRIGRWWSYFGSGVAIALVAIVMALAPRTPFSFTAGVIVYALFCGMAYAAFSAVILFAIGRGAASTKYATLSSLGNLPVVYMTASNGWVHDRFCTAWMLHSEALVAIACIVLALLVLGKIYVPRAQE